MHADVYGYPEWSDVTVLALGAKPGWRGSFGGKRKDVTVHFAPGAENAFDVAEADVRKFDELARPPMEKGQHLMDEDFRSDDRWTYVAGTWTVGGGTLVETSPQGRFAWAVAGEKQWANYRVEAQVRTQDASSHVYLCGRWQDVENHYELQCLDFPAHCMRLVRVAGGERMTLAERRELPDLRARPPTKLALEMCGNRLRGYRNDELLLEAFDGRFLRGQIALGTAAVYQVWFHHVDVFGLKKLPEGLPSVRLTQPVQRRGFYRDERAANMRFLVSADAPLDNATATLALTNERYPTHGELAQQAIPVGQLKPGEKRALSFDLHPQKWRSGDYVLTVSVTQNDRLLAKERTSLFIRRRPPTSRMLVNCWGRGDPELLARYGFNQLEVWHTNTMSRWDGGKYRTPDNPMSIFDPDYDALRQHVLDKFDECLKHGLWAYMRINYIRRVPEGVTEAYALKRDGKSLQDRASGYHGAGQPRANPWHPKVAETITNHFRKSLVAWKEHPAWRAALLNSESSREFDVYGNDYWLKMAEKELGFAVPGDVSHTWGAKGRPLPDDGIVESDDPYYRFYRWWWERGEGQGQLHAKVAGAVKEVRPDVVAWHDPLLRQPCVRGRLAGLDRVLHWAYAWPNVARFPLIADELRLAALEEQERIFNIQTIVWGSVAIPRKGPHWCHLKRPGQLYLPAHSPSTVSEALWLVLSRGVSGVSFHGLETASREALEPGSARKQVEGVGYRGYVYSNPDTLETIGTLNKRLVRPYGRILKRLSPARGQVAMLLSTANLVLTCRDAEDFVVDEAGHMYAKLLAAHVPVDPVYEVDLEREGLDGYKAVALPGCRVLPRHIYNIIRDFVAKGGIVIGDQHLVPKFASVVQLPRRHPAWGGEAPLHEERVDQIPIVRKALDAQITRYADCDSASVILSVMEDGPTRYLFAVNDLRRVGDYLGPWGKVLDDGVAQRTKLRVRRSQCVIYDALAQRTVLDRTDGEWLTWDLQLGPGEGRMYVVRPSTISRVAVAGPETVTKGTIATVTVSVHTEKGTRAAGLVPLRVTIRGSQGIINDYSDYYVATDGTAKLTFPVARNEPSGDWCVEARELFGGVTGRIFFKVEADSKAGEADSGGLVQVPEMWLFQPDPKRVGEREKWFSPNHDTERWRPLSTHGFWNEFFGGATYEGDGWYAIDLTIPAAAGKRVWLVLGAVDENYTLWLNGQYVSDNLDAGTTMWDKPVPVDITNHYRPGAKNHIVVRARNTIGAGGIWQPVRVVTGK